MINPKFHGTNVVFWVGVVEQRDDSKAKDKKKLGRVRVRILGYHSDSLTENDTTGEGLPVNKLPWAYPIAPITSASMSGIGESPTGVVEGTWVMGLAMDGPAMQDLYYLGTLPGVPSKTSSGSNTGFRDPNGKYPKSDHLGESDVPRLARAEKISETSVQEKKNKLERFVLTAKAYSWSEPNVPYAAKYPFNHVRQTESGHLQEFDDTSGAERIQTRHTKGTFEEWHPDGSEVRKIFGDGYEIHLKDRNMLIKGDLNITVEGDARLKSRGSMYIESDKDIDLRALGSINMWSLKGIKMQTLKKITIFGLFGVSVGAIKGKASIGSPVNTAGGSARFVG